MTLGSHQTAIGRSQTYITPKWVIDALGPFDLDPCAASPRPWDCAKRNVVLPEDGLSIPWTGRIWLNPPFDRRQVGLWIDRLARHGQGTTLLHARTETEWFQTIWTHASAILFLEGRLTFCDKDGRPYAANSGAPPALAAFGEEDSHKLFNSKIPGSFISQWSRR